MKLIKLIPIILALAGCSSGGSSEGEVLQQDAETVVVESDSEETARFNSYFQSAYNSGEVWECIRISIKYTGTNQVDRILSNWNTWAFSFNPEARELTSYSDSVQTVQGANLATNSSFVDSKGQYFKAVALMNETPDFRWFDDNPVFYVRFVDDKTMFGYYGLIRGNQTTDVRCRAKEYSVVTVVNELISTLPAY